MKLSKKLLSLLLCAVMVLGSVAVGGGGFAQVLDDALDALSVKASASDDNTVDNNIFIQRLNEEKEKFKQGEYFAGNCVNLHSENKNLTHSSKEKLCNGDYHIYTSCCDDDCNCDCGSYFVNGIWKAGQCNAFACTIGLDIFGSDPYGGWTNTGYNRDAVDNILPGDRVRYNYHAIFVTNVIGNNIYFGEANYSGRCLIDWDRDPITKDELTKLLSNETKDRGIYRAPNNTIVLGEHGVDSEAPDITNIDTITEIDHTGFTISFNASDNMGIANVSAVVWGSQQTYEEAVSRSQSFVGNYDASTKKGTIRINIGDGEGQLRWISEQYYAVIRVEDISGNYAINPEENTQENKLLIAPIRIDNSTEGKYKANKDNKGQIWPQNTLFGETTEFFEYQTGDEIKVYGSYYNSNENQLYYRVNLGSEGSSANIYVKADNFDKYESFWDGIYRLLIIFANGQTVYADENTGRMILGNTKQVLKTPKTKHYPSPWEEDSPTEPTNTVASGTCGNKVRWNLSDDGVLTISGTGAMTNYSYSSAPWYSSRSSIKTVVIENGVTSIGDYAFYYCTDLTNVTIPDSVTSIGGHAFYWCTNLKSITIPNSVTSIGKWAFYYCIGLTNVIIPDGVTSISDGVFASCNGLRSVTIPDSVTSIGDSAFDYCTSLTSLTIPDSVTEIDSDAFYQCEFSSINVSPDNISYCSIDGVLYNKDITVLILYPNRKESHEFSIPDSVVSIYDDAFYNCTKIYSLNIGENFSGGTNVIYAGDANNDIIYSLMEMIHLKEIKVHENNQYFCADDTVLFNKDKSLLLYHCPESSETSYCIPNSTTRISYGAFRYSKNLKSILIPDSVTSIGNDAFYNCKNLNDIIISCNITDLGQDSFKGTAFYNCSSNWNDNLLYLDRYLLDSNKKQLDNADVTIKEGTVLIASCVFSNVSIKSITIPKSVIYFGASAFLNNKSEEFNCYYNGTVCDWCNIHFSNEYSSPICQYYYYSGTKYHSIPEGVHYVYFNNELVTDLIIPDSITEINNYAFYCFKQFKSITIPNSVKYIGKKAFCGCENVNQIYFNANISQVKLTCYSGSITIGSYDNSFLYCGINSPDFTINFGTNVISIPGYLFYCNGEKDYLKKVYIPKSVTSIGEDAFPFNSSIIEIFYEGDIEDKNKIDRVNVFYGNGIVVAKIFDSIIWHYNVNAWNNTHIHNFDSDWVYNDEFHWKVCSCNEIGKKYCHQMDSGEITTPATITTTGIKTYTCLVCGYKEYNTIPKVITTTIKDETTGVELIYPNIYGNNVKLFVEGVFNDNVLNILNNLTYIESVKIFDVKFLVNGEETQPKTTVIVRIPLPEGYDSSKTFVYHVDTQTNKVEKMNTRHENGFMVFETNHFSYYAIVEENTFEKTNINVAGAKTIDYRSIVTITTTATDVPENYKLVMFVNGSTVAAGDNKSVSYSVGELKSDVNYTVKVVDAKGNVQKDSNGNELSKDGGKITCNAGFFKKLIAFFKGLFKSLPKVEVKP